MVIAAGRARRPGAARGHVAAPSAEELAACPFCEGHEAQTPPETFATGREGRAPDSPGWDVRVVPNKFPAFVPDARGPVSHGLLACRPARGRHEVVVHTPRHARSLAELDPAELRGVALAWQARAATARREGFAYVHALLNEGAGAGASLPHSHSQLVWLPEVPPEADIVLREEGGCRLCGLLRLEIADERRVVVEREGLVGLCRFAGRLPYEVLIAPLAHEPDGFGAQLPAALGLLAETMRRLQALEGLVPVNAWLRTAPLQGGDAHWHLELLPRLAIPAGIELGAGYFVNTLSPEDAASVLREAADP